MLNIVFLFIFCLSHNCEAHVWISSSVRLLVFQFYQTEKENLSAFISSIGFANASHSLEAIICTILNVGRQLLWPKWILTFRIIQMWQNYMEYDQQSMAAVDVKMHRLPLDNIPRLFHGRSYRKYFVQGSELDYKENFILNLRSYYRQRCSIINYFGLPLHQLLLGKHDVFFLIKWKWHECVFTTHFRHRGRVTHICVCRHWFK